MADELFDGRRIRLLTIVDHFARESLAIVVGQRLGGHEVVEALNRIGKNRRLPKTIQVDNGTEFTSKALDQWAYANQVTLDFSCCNNFAKQANLRITRSSNRSTGEFARNV